MWTADSLEKSLMLGKIEVRRRRGPQRMRWLDGITDAMDMNGLGQNLGDGEGQGGLECYNSWGHKESDTTGWLNNSKSLSTIFEDSQSTHSMWSIQGPGESHTLAWWRSLYPFILLVENWAPERVTKLPSIPKARYNSGYRKFAVGTVKLYHSGPFVWSQLSSISLSRSLQTKETFWCWWQTK